MRRSRITTLLLPLVLLVVALAVLQGSATGRDEAERPAPVPADPTLTALLTRDMSAVPEARPHGVPSDVDWADRPRAKPFGMPDGYRELTGWGQLFACATARPDLPRAPVEIADLETRGLGRDGRWRLLQPVSAIHGGAYVEDFDHNASTDAGVRASTPSSTFVRLQADRNFHFYPTVSRASVAPGEVSDVLVSVRARLAPGNPTGEETCQVLGAGADYWRAGADWQEGGVNNYDAGIGRLKRVGRDWRLFTMTTASPAVLEAHPVPIDRPAAELR